MKTPENKLLILIFLLSMIAVLSSRAASLPNPAGTVEKTESCSAVRWSKMAD